MVGEFTFKIEGARELEKLLKELGSQLASKVGDQAVRAAARIVADEARRLVPVRTGDLRDSIAVKIERRSKGADERVAIVGQKRPGSSLAHLTEFGTSKAPAQPFMRPALDAKADEALNEMGKVLGRGIEREAQRLATKLVRSK